MAGVQITRSSGDPTSGATIRVRGVTTLSTNDPLVIVDGIPGDINDIAPEDVKDIQVLKDAASAAIRFTCGCRCHPDHNKTRQG